jgi:hypothetical protein
LLVQKQKQARKMPFKAKQKNPSCNPRKKPTYKVINWTEYNRSLKKRGELSLYFPRGDLRSQFINEEIYICGISGQQATYKQPYIELIYLFYRLFGWGMRQMTGYFEDLWCTKKLDIPVPSFGHLSDLFADLPLKVRQFCEKLAKRTEHGELITLIFDSTGLRVGKASHWYETKYEKPCNQTPWRKLHLSMDPEMNVHNIEITDTETPDIEMIDNLISEEIASSLEKIIADGGYYSKEAVEELYNKGIIPAIPPPSNSVVQGKETTQWHDKIVQYIKDKGSIYAFHKKYGYGVRALVEAQISRIKRCIGSSLKTQRIESQKREGIIIANIINKWNSFGKCICVKAG